MNALALPSAIFAALNDDDVCGNRTAAGPCASCIDRAGRQLSAGTPVADLLAAIEAYRAEGEAKRTGTPTPALIAA